MVGLRHLSPRNQGSRGHPTGNTLLGHSASLGSADVTPKSAMSVTAGTSHVTITNM